MAIKSLLSNNQASIHKNEFHKRFRKEYWAENDKKGKKSEFPTGG